MTDIIMKKCKVCNYIQPQNAFLGAKAARLL